MALWTPGCSAGFVVDNWGANPSATPGTSVTPGTSGAEGSWTQVLAALAQEVSMLYLRVSDSSATAPKNTFLDIGWDPSGGTSYTEMISNIVVGSAAAITAAGAGLEFLFPIRIPQTAAVAVRARGVSGTPGTLRVGVRGYGYRSAPWAFPVGQYAETIGVSETTAVDATAITPGNAADGSWVSLGTTTRECWWWQLAYQIDNATITAEYTYIELAVGDGSNKDVILRVMHSGTTGETCGLALNENLVPCRAYRRVPAGSTLYARGRCNNAPDTGYQAAAIGIGG